MTQTPNLAPAKLEWRHVTKRFGANKVLDGLNLSVGKGRSLALLGRSGQGKSVTIKVALGLMRADGGAVLLDGVDVTHLHERERRASFAGIGMLFQGAALFDSLSVWENVGFRLINAGARRGIARSRRWRWCDWGQRWRIAIRPSCRVACKNA